jgi:hypothetical protein
MELAAQFGNQLQFDRFRRELEIADLTSQLRANYLMAVGTGYAALDEYELAVEYLARAVDFAAANALNQIMFEAESALDEAKRNRRKLPTVSEYVVDADVATVINAIEDLKLAAGV